MMQLQKQSNLVIGFMGVFLMVFFQDLSAAEDNIAKAKFRGTIKEYKTQDAVSGKCQLNVDVEIQAAMEGDFILRGFLGESLVKDEFTGEPMYGVDSKNIHLAPGTHVVTLSFPGDVIYEGKFTKFILTDLELVSPETEGRLLYDRRRDIVLAHYDYRDFKRKGLHKEFSIHNGGQFSLASGQSAVLEFKGFGTKEIALSGIRADAVELILAREGMADSEKESKGIFGERVVLKKGEQVRLPDGIEMGTFLKLVAINRAEAQFKVDYYSAPPAPRILPWQKISIGLYGHF